MRIQEEICRKLWKSSPPKSTDEAQTCFSLEILCTEWMNGRRNAHSSLTGAKSPKILSLFWLLGHQTNVKIRKRTIISLRICSVFATLFTVKWWFSICWTIIILSLSSLLSFLSVKASIFTETFVRLPWPTVIVVCSFLWWTHMVLFSQVEIEFINSIVWSYCRYRQ